MASYIVMIKRIIFTISIVLNFGIAVAQENTWHTNGPDGGSVVTMEFHPNNHDIFFIGTVQNGMYKTTNGGQSWQHIENNGLFSCMRDIAIHPNSPDTIFVSTTTGIYRSNNGGVDWEFVELPEFSSNEIKVIKYHPENRQIIFAGGPINTWKSLDGGNSWESLTVPVWTGMDEIEINPQNNDVIYFIGSSMATGRGVWKSIDRGATWLNIQNNIDSTGAPTDLTLNPADTSMLMISMNNVVNPGNPSLYRSTNSGESWVGVGPESLSITYATNVMFSPLETNTVYLVSKEDGVFKSEDLGNTWNSYSDGLKFNRNATIEIDESNSILYLGTYYDGIYKRLINEGGWIKISKNINAASCIQLDICSLDDNSGYVSATNGLFKTNDMGETWLFLDIGMSIYTGNSGIAIDKYQNNIIYVSSSHRSLYPIEDAGFYISEDSGSTWNFYNSGLPGNISYRDICISYLSENEKRIFLISSEGLYYSDDLGRNWQLNISLPTSIYLEVIDIATSNSNCIAVGDHDNNVYISEDLGDTWNQTGELPDFEHHEYIIDIEFDPIDENHIFVASCYLGLFESTNGGEEWRNINNNVPLDPAISIISGIVINPNNLQNIFVASNHYGIYRSFNGGQNWESFNNGMDTTDGVGEMILIPGDTTKFYFASSQRSIWTFKQTSTDIIVNNAILPTQYNLSTYPNPFNASTNISFTLIQPSQVTLDIYDILGRRAESLVDWYLPAGNHSVLWQAGELPSGIYFYRITAGEYHDSRKITLLK